MNILEQIIDVARWAPSGDNAQPWRFEIAGENRLIVHGFDTRRECVYDFQGHASHIAQGALLENIAIAASVHSLKSEIAIRGGCDEHHPVFEVTFSPEKGMQPDPLAEHIRTRSVQRRPYSTKALTSEQKAKLAASLGARHEVLWQEGLKNRMRMAKLVSDAGKLRLTIPEAYQVHRNVIEWNSKYSEDKVPDQAVGLDRISLVLMRQVLASWKRVDFFNTYLGGTLIPRIELDAIPALACAAHFFIIADSKPQSLSDFVSGGRAVQRFWLTATSLGLQLQPEMSPLIFANYARGGIPVSERRQANILANRLAESLGLLAGNAAGSGKILFMGRIGMASPAKARSLRLPVSRLMR